MRRPFEAIVLAFPLAAAFAPAVFLPRAAMAQESIDIGFSSPLTGPQALAGKDNQAGANMAIAELNGKKLTIGGKPAVFRLLPEDDQANPKIGVAMAARLIDAKVKAIVGPYNSDVAIAASRMINDAGIVMITVGSNPRITQQGFRSIFRAGPNDNQLGGEMAIYAANQLNLKKVLVIEDGTAYGKGIADAFVAAARAGKIEIAGRKSSAEKPDAFDAILASIKGKQVDGIFYGGYYAQAAALKTAMKKMAIDAALMGGDAICNTEAGKLAGAAINDKVYCVQGGARLGARAVERTFLTGYRQLYGKSPSSFGANFYDGVKMIGAAMQKADSADPARFAPVLASMRYAGVVGDYEFDAAHDLKNSPVTIYQFKNGEPIAVPAN
ncbi:branched-chain amino acid ABC transporter substrate-binding protein [Oxalobacteraceae bacterium CAVE-383]|nr:branched-chain amino acid ABC transporter substrate-binding protein [Oxalobacteraceae bacterium CAVE-383]